MTEYNLVDRRNYGEQLKEIAYERLGQFEAVAVLERPDGTRFRRHRKSGSDWDTELPVNLPTPRSPMDREG